MSATDTQYINLGETTALAEDNASHDWKIPGNPLFDRAAGDQLVKLHLDGWNRTELIETAVAFGYDAKTGERRIDQMIAFARNHRARADRNRAALAAAIDGYPLSGYLKPVVTHMADHR